MSLPPISFSGQSLSAAVEALLSSSTTNDERFRIGAMIEAWQSQLESMPVAVGILTESTEPNIVFFALGAIQYVFENHYECLSVDNVAAVWTLLITRLNDEQHSLDEKCRNKVLVCLSVISVHFPEFIDRWQEINIRDTVPYFALLFEAHGSSIESDDSFCEKMLAIQNEQNVLVSILQANEMSPAWLILVNHLWESDFHVLYQFAPKFGQVLENPSLFSAFTDLFKGMVSGEIYTMDNDDKNFLEQFMRIMVTFAEQALRSDDLETGIPVACLTFSEIFDFAPEFLVEPERHEFAVQVLKALNSGIRTIVAIPEELNALFDPLVVLFQHLWSYGSPELCSLIVEFVDTMIELINEDSSLMSMVSANIFRGASTAEHDPRAVPVLLVEYYRRKITTLSNGLIFAISSSSQFVRRGFAPALCEATLRTMPPEVAMYFIENCCYHCVEHIGFILQYLYSVMSKVWNRAVADALVAVTQFFGKLFVDNPKELIEPLVNIIEAADAPGFVPMMKALINILPHTEEEQKGQLISVITRNIERLIRDAISRDDVNGLFEFLFEIVRSKRAEFIDLYCTLFEAITRMIEPLWTMKSEMVMSNLCVFVEMSSDRELSIVNDTESIVNWIANAITLAPVAQHFHLLKEIIANESHIKLLEGKPQIFEFILHVNQIDDSELAEEAVGFVVQFGQRCSERLLGCFPPEFFISLLGSVDPKIIEEGLLLISSIIMTPPMMPFVEQVVNVIVQGMFRTFTENCIASAFELFLRLIDGNVCTKEALAGCILGCVTGQGKEVEQFTASLAAGDRNGLIFHGKRMIRSARRARNPQAS